MALDGLYLHSIVQELKTALINGRISKINQPEKDEIILTIRGTQNKNYKLLISSNPTYPRIHLTELNKKNPLKAPMFCMVMRKYLSGSKILDIKQIKTDRIIVINFNCNDELGFDSVYSLIIEIMGRHSNITLVREKDNKVMDSIKHLTPDINRYRCIYPGITFTYPPYSSKLDPLHFTYEDFNTFVQQNNILFDNNFFSNVFTGVGKCVSKELLSQINPIKYSTKFTEYIYIQSKDFFENFCNNKFNYICYLNNTVIKDFYCVNLNIYGSLKKEIYDSPSKLLEKFFYKKDKQVRLHDKSINLQKVIHVNLERCEKKQRILNDTLKQCEKKDKFKLYGELLTSNIYNIKKGDSSISVLNYYNDNEPIIIKLTENKTPSQNIQYFYKKYNKLKKSEEMSKEQLKANEDELNYLSSVLTNIQMADNYEEIEEIKNELINTGYIKFNKNHSSKKNVKTKPMHFISSEGMDIYVGKNNFQNDFLTLKFANKHDIWMHTKNIPGSHVIIRKTLLDNLSSKTLLEGALLAAFYSKANTSSNVPVDYTEVKNVKKPSGAKPGMVIYYTNKTLYVTPKEPTLLKKE